ncbi:MAG: hypothetical protein COA47_12960 [Robiginitomaculum sp.]|nr:MAG: hypothetical protein COA47_12960 [Robiginitomaculum sp.]
MSDQPERQHKRFFWFKAAIATLILISLLGVYARFIEPKTLIVRNFDVTIAGWSGPTLRVIVLSDTHVGGRHMSAARVAKIMNKVRTLSPDLVLLAGDYVGGHLPMDQHSAESRQEITDGLIAFGTGEPKFGTYAVLGNHDWWYDGGQVRSQLEQAGISVLTNEVALADIDGWQLQIAGIGDITTHHADTNALMAQMNPALPSFTLTHNPDVFVGFTASAAMNFAGHTHGGQVWLPFLGRPGVPSKYGQRFARGRYDDDPGIIMVTSGIGTSLLPIRFMTPPEIMVVRITGGS